MSKREKSIYGYFTATAKKKKNKEVEEVNSGKSGKL